MRPSCIVAPTHLQRREGLALTAREAANPNCLVDASDLISEPRLRIDTSRLRGGNQATGRYDGDKCFPTCGS